MSLIGRTKIGRTKIGRTNDRTFIMRFVILAQCFLNTMRSFLSWLLLVLLVAVLTACSGGSGGNGGGGNGGDNGGRISSGADSDGDGVSDELDVDDDGDGFIEIATPMELDAVRYQLNATGQRLSEDGDLNQAGCGDGDSITSCNGYELVRDIDITRYIRDNYEMEGWQPLGDCEGFYNAIFEGNNYKISGLSINRPGQDCVGLFGHVRMNAKIRNLTLHAEGVLGNEQVGTLAGGSTDDIQVLSSSVVVGNLSGKQDVGGLIGDGGRGVVIGSSVVAGNINGEQDVGGLTGYGRDATIIASSVEVGNINGESRRIGGLVGNGLNAKITSASALVGSISGTSQVGGLVGAGRSARIHYSSVEVGNVSGTGNGGDVGGLIGDGELAQIFSSSVVVGNIDGVRDIGGLIGSGETASIFSSSVVLEIIRGEQSTVGGLIGEGDAAKIFSSVAVVSKPKGRLLGGLAAEFRRLETLFPQLAYSYAVFGKPGADTDINMLVRTADMANVTSSYWDNDTSGIQDGNIGEKKSTNQLRSPMNYTGIYASWDNEMDIFGDGLTDEPLAVWCDRDNSGSIEIGEQTNDNLIWDFGTDVEYPAIRCTPLKPAEWRSWWFLDGDGAPQLNQTRLDELLPSPN